MHCNGKCYLHKQLAKENKQGDNSTNDVKIKIESAVFLFQETPEPIATIINSNNPPHSRYIGYLLPGINTAVFHPPLA